MAQAAAATALPYGRKPIRTFALIVALPVVLLYVASAVLVFTALALMAQDMDRRENARQLTSVNAALAAFLADLAGAVADEGTWNEAYLNVVVTVDPAWMDSTWGATARLGDSYDSVIVTDAAGTIQFGEDNMGPITGHIADRFPSARTMLRDLETGIAATGDATTVANFADSDSGPLGLAAISIHRSALSEVDVPRQLRRVLWLGKHLTAGEFQEFTVRYQTPLASFVTAVPADSSSLQIVDAEDATLATVAWTPDRPGEASLRPATLVASATFLGIGLVLVPILGLIRRAIVTRVRQFELAMLSTPAAATPAVHAASVAVEAEAAAAETDELPPAFAGVRATEFTMDYQPVLDLRAESLIGVEALMRWQVPDKPVLTQESLSPADCAVLLDRVAMLALRHAASEIAPLIGLNLALAVSANQIKSSVFTEKLAATLGVTKMPTRRLELDLDAALEPDIVALAPAIVQLRQTGIGVGLSNYTLGPILFDFIRGGLIDRVRLAPAMLAGIDTDPLRRRLVEASVAAALDAGLTIVASGITRREEAVLLLRMGVSHVQGDVFAQALPLAALTNLALAPPRQPAIRRAS